MKGCATRRNYKFEGKERDGETGNDDFGARYYTSRLGRWLSADWSAVPAPVPYANPTNPQTLNLYAMVSDNPETFADLDGHCAEDLCILEGSAGVVVGLYVGGAAVLAGGGAYLNTPSGQRSLSTFTSAASTSISNSVHNIENFFTKSDKPAPTKPYDTGQAKDLKGNSQVGDGLDVHHVPQSQPASQTVEGYNKETAPAIALPKGEHQAIPTEKGEAARSPRDQLAKDAKDLRNNTNAPNSQIQKLIDQNKAQYPEMNKPESR